MSGPLTAAHGLASCLEEMALQLMSRYSLVQFRTDHLLKLDLRSCSTAVHVNLGTPHSSQLTIPYKTSLWLIRRLWGDLFVLWWSRGTNGTGGSSRWSEAARDQRDRGVQTCETQLISLKALISIV